MAFLNTNVGGFFKFKGKTCFTRGDSFSFLEAFSKNTKRMQLIFIFC